VEKITEENTFGAATAEDEPYYSEVTKVERGAVVPEAGSSRRGGAKQPHPKYFTIGFIKFAE